MTVFGTSLQGDVNVEWPVLPGGGELFDRVMAHKVFSERDAAGVLFNLLSALSYNARAVLVLEYFSQLHPHPHSHPFSADP